MGNSSQPLHGAAPPPESPPPSAARRCRRRCPRARPAAPERIVKVDPAHTSQACNACGRRARDNHESRAVFRCVACGHQANADVNAARHIRRHRCGTHGGRAGRRAVGRAGAPRTSTPSPL
ncbi:transposase [Actinomadura sp. NAK00032]|uniref:transposase n=1 Tax=Actinomadura sp. NAK00032 TaxID=2742128 RepID=UPI0020C78CC2|nr:transposase [Actinomadura sp. NAK00032]